MLLEEDFPERTKRKVKRILPLVRLIHSVATDSVLEQLAKHGDDSTEVLVEVNVAGEESKGGVAVDELGAFIERCPVRVAGLMAMPRRLIALPKHFDMEVEERRVARL